MFEANIIKFLQSNLSVGWIAFFQGFTALASFWGLVLFAIIIGTKSKKLAVWYAISFGFLALFNFLFKFLFMRARPFQTYDFIINYDNESGYSMPSSHAAVATLTAMFLIYWALKYCKSKYLKWAVSIVMPLFVIAICLSRMVLGVHYLTDTVVGVVVGLVIGGLALWIYHKIFYRLIIKIKMD